ncbi:hypothetical protein [Roseivirga echinicomitans]|uniref:GIY-YIG domain-containing protein n=1 Tax=Roseivirga echinicomitans TaxID=296218 RepID=A0A150XEM4_9BACT|nr:hypothetical protein [Roseivirga echinicomitans]KYG77167.1 hypothetical protein AWN68_18210 [Roseivirga echinicomitans]
MIENENWSSWRKMPRPEDCRNIEGPQGSGVYQIREVGTKRKILFGIGVECQKRMKSLYPKPYGVGTRNNEDKRKFILKNWSNLEFRTLATKTRDHAKNVEDIIKDNSDHLFNT